MKKKLDVRLALLEAEIRGLEASSLENKAQARAWTDQYKGLCEKYEHVLVQRNAARDALRELIAWVEILHPKAPLQRFKDTCHE